MIEVKKLKKSFESKLVLDNVNFKVCEGEFAIIFGLNGEGKTTIIKCLIGLLERDSGFIQLSPEDKSMIGLYMGHEMLIEKLTVYEYLMYVGVLKNLSSDFIKNKIKKYSHLLNFEMYLNKFISQISFGTKSKVLFTASIINEPKLLILDEPFIGLDLITFKEISNIMLSLKKEGCTIFISSHQINNISSLIDKILILSNKKIVLEKSIDDLKIYNDTELTNYIISYLENKH
jgi:ABC-2 type transport system ATP-binding protein